jgi:hypothetical protein
LNSAEAQANGGSGGVISASGRFVALSSAASNLVTGDNNGVSDAFVRDLQNGTTRRVSVSSAGAQANAESYVRFISPDGRYIVFVSSASNLVPNDTNGVEDVFLRDTQIGTTERVSLGPNGRQANHESLFASISANGRYVAFSTLATNLGVTDVWETYDDVFVRERGGTNLLLAPRALYLRQPTHQHEQCCTAGHRHERQRRPGGSEAASRSYPDCVGTGTIKSSSSGQKQTLNNSATSSLICVTPASRFAL